MKSRLSKLYSFLGKEVSIYFGLSFIAGFLWFLLESSFVFILQIFLITIGIMEKAGSQVAFLPDFTILQASLVLVGFGALRGFALFFKTHVSNVTQQIFVNNKRKEIIAYGLNSSTEIDSSETMTLFSEIVIMTSGVMHQVTTLLISGITSLLFAAYGFYLAPKEMMIGLALLMTLAIPFKLVSKSIHSSGEGLVTEWNKINDILLMGLRNNFLLRVYNLVGSEVSKGQKIIDRYCDYQKSYSLSASFISALPMLVGVVVIAVIVYLSVTYFKTPGVVLLSFLYIFIRLAQGSSEVFNTISLIRFSSYALKRLYEWHCEKILEPQKLITAVEEKKEFEPISSISVDQLSFTYPETTELVLNDLSFKASLGEAVLIKGESGSGKSTLLSLILGLLEPTKGKISFNEDVSKLDHQQIAYVGPESYIIPGTIRENLLYGATNNKVSEELIWEKLKLAKIDDVVREQENGLEQYLNEFTQLSTGQKQRLSLARAFLREPKILVLDEATANLDSETENEIITQLEDCKKDFISIVISHKNSFDNFSDKIIDLNV